MGDPRHRLGIEAERAVASHLDRLGWQVLASRWRCPMGELDLVCLDVRGALVGVEVRARRSIRAGSPVESVDRRRLRRLRASLATYAAAHRGPVAGLRLDLAAVEAAGGAWRITIHHAVDAW